MKSESDLKYFYDSTLSGLLKGLEGKRRILVSKIIAVWAVLGSVSLSGLLISVLLVNPGIAVAMFIFSLIIGLIIHFIFFNSGIKSFTTEFKERIVGEIVRFIDKNLVYTPKNGIPQSAYMNSTIFPTNPDMYNSEDHVSGKIGETQIEFSKVHSLYKTESTDSKGKHRTEWHTIFNGLFFIADFNKNFTGTTLVLPDFAEKNFGVLGKMFQSWNLGRNERLVKLEDPEFEKIFVVYGDNQITARYILTPGIMQRIVEFRNKLDDSVYMSFRDSKIYVAISNSGNMLEPRIFRSNEDFALIKKYFENLSLACMIVEELNLNTRIWK
jgi:hypothetical protein